MAFWAMVRTTRFSIAMISIASCLLAPTAASAYFNNGRWATTATDGQTNPLGRAVTVTWSIVPDGTTISHLAKPSNLISVFDGMFSGSVGVPLVEKPWFSLLEQSFDRWSAVSGITYQYEPADDGASHGTAFGLLGVRGDVRIGGASIDGAGGTLAEAGFIPNADITIDTADTAHFGNSGGGTYIHPRSTFMHEIGHSVGLGHSSSFNAAFLMEALLQTSFDGPQIDDIRGAHYLYGDFHEKSNEGAGNDTFVTATPLGTLAASQSVLIGEEGGTGTVVLASETDFLSISNSDDVDVFSFSVEYPSVIDLVLTPVGATYNERSNIVASALSNLSLELYFDNNGAPQLLNSANLNGTGQAESLLDLTLAAAGTYYARVTGSADAVQLYQLQLDVNEQFLPGDFNGDAQVDAADFTLWRDHLGNEDESAISNRGDGLNGVDAADLVIWQDHYGATLVVGGAGAQNVPEPAAIASLLAALGAALGSIRKVNILPRN